MINSRKDKKLLVIVYDKKSESYANHLMQLIGLNDDKDDKVVGVKDGTVKAVMWDEKKYKENEIKTTSEEKLVFIGRSKITKHINENAVKRYSKYGIEYGWLGNRAAITVSKKINSKADYENFIKEAQVLEKNFEEKKSDKLNITPDDTIANIFGSKIFAPLALPFLGVGNGIIAAARKVKKEFKFQKKARKQRFSFAVLKFYYEHLSEFVKE